MKKLMMQKHVYPEKVLQFGTGNFLRAFTVWMIDRMNKESNFNGSVVTVQSTNSGTADKINRQNGLYTLCLQGIVDDQPVKEYEVIHSISRALNLHKQYNEYIELAKSPDLRFVVSNTTEAGIVYDADDCLDDRPQNSFPGKLTAFLYHRFQYFKGNKSKGLIIIPCELIDRNGDMLKEIILQLADDWGLEANFADWIKEANYFCNSLVDRIVPGFPKDQMEEIEAELGYRDELIVTGEQYHLWAIEGPDFLREEFPAEEVGLNVKIVEDLAPFRESKVYILNGAHTAMTPIAYLCGLETVGETMEDPETRRFVEELILEEVIPGTGLPEAEMKAFAKDVLNRFSNPFIQHYLLSISLNAMAKFKARNLPVLLSYVEKYEKVPERIAFALGAWIAFYRGKRGDEDIQLSDEETILAFFKKIWSSHEGSEQALREIVKSVLAYEKLWDQDLNEIQGLTESVWMHLLEIERNGMQSALKNIVIEKV
ncbi:tagaturonate reductase [Lederbergia citrea]|uniref:Tagaturonate reductase n=1 Tax=Lederbergia citrea TaxID=2833581 RepID=A0A942UMS6_9BACI|nr:tagaturonate reductase [Lederbergia citrea]MBS4224230.1 tagaturonate reductase [Lederbergia citrea]